MKKFSLKEHNKKIFDITNKAAKGVYPSKKIARAGSFFGTVIGVFFLFFGMLGAVSGYIWGFGTLLAGVITIISNIFNLKRIGKITR